MGMRLKPYPYPYPILRRFTLRWEAAGGRPALADFYMQVMDAVNPICPGCLLLVEGTGATNYKANWGMPPCGTSSPPCVAVLHPACGGCLFLGDSQAPRQRSSIRNPELAPKQSIGHGVRR